MNFAKYASASCIFYTRNAASHLQNSLISTISIQSFCHYNVISPHNIIHSTKISFLQIQTDFHLTSINVDYAILMLFDRPFVSIRVFRKCTNICVQHKFRFSVVVELKKIKVIEHRLPTIF